IPYVTQIKDLAVVQDGQGRALRQRYVPSSSGSPVVTFPTNTAGGNEVWLSFRLLFENGWQFVLGGKLPGLAGGTMPTGGDFDDNGFSARFMWRENGTVAVYAYHHDRPGVWGEDFYLTNADGSRWRAPIGQWITLRQRIKMNTTG